METRRANLRYADSDGNRSATKRCIKEANQGIGGGGGNPKKGGSHLRTSKLKRYKFVDDEKRNYSIKLLCLVMQVSQSGRFALGAND